MPSALRTKWSNGTYPSFPFGFWRRKVISIKTPLIAPFVIAALISPALSADRSNGHALALSHRYGAYTKPGNLAAGQTVVIDTPEGPITCTGGVDREYTGRKVQRVT
jgi:hypothetical protein